MITQILDILGTCYNDKRRPATFLHKHIEKYQMRKRNGLWSFGPEQLEEVPAAIWPLLRMRSLTAICFLQMMKNGRVKCEQGVLSWIDSVQADAHSRSQSYSSHIRLISNDTKLCSAQNDRGLFLFGLPSSERIFLRECRRLRAGIFGRHLHRFRLVLSISCD